MTGIYPPVALLLLRRMAGDADGFTPVSARLDVMAAVSSLYAYLPESQQVGFAVVFSFVIAIC